MKIRHIDSVKNNVYTYIRRENDPATCEVALSHYFSSESYRALLGRIARAGLSISMLVVILLTDKDSVAQASPSVGHSIADVAASKQEVDHEGNLIRLSTAEYEALLVQVKSKNPDIWVPALKKVARLGDQRFVGVIAEKLADDNEMVSLLARMAVLINPTPGNPDFEASEDPAVREVLIQVYIKVLNARSKEARIDALDSLKIIGDKSVVNIIKAKLNDPVPEVREAAKKALQKLASSLSEQEMQWLFEEALDPVETSYWAIEKLGFTGDPRAIPVLVKVVEQGQRHHVSTANDALKNLLASKKIILQANLSVLNSAVITDKFVKTEAMEALGILGDISAAEPILEELAKGQVVVPTANRILLKWGVDKERIFQANIKAFELDPDLESTIELFKFMGATKDEHVLRLIAEKSFFSPTDGQQMRDALIQAGVSNEILFQTSIKTLKQKNPKAIFFAINFLKNLGDKRAIDSLSEQVSSSDVMVRSSAVETMKYLGADQDRITQTYIKALSASNLDARLDAITSLVSFGRREDSLEAMKSLLNDKDVVVREAARDSLMRFGVATQLKDQISYGTEKAYQQLMAQQGWQHDLSGTEFQELLSRLKISSSFIEGNWILKILRRVHNKEAIGAIADVMFYMGRGLEEEAQYTLEEIGVDKEVFFNAAIRGLSSPNVDDRGKAIRFLGSFGDKRAIVHITERLSDDMIINPAWEALQKLGADKEMVFQATVKALNANSALARSNAIKFLGSTGDRRAVAMIADLLGDTDVLVRICAKDVLKSMELNKETIFQAYVKASRSGDLGARADAVEFLAQLNDRRAIPVIKERLLDLKAKVRQAARDALSKLGIAEDSSHGSGQAN